MQRRDLDLRAHISAVAGDRGEALRGPFYVRRDGGLHEAARLALVALDGQGLAHDMVDHVCSSQAFALNLFAGLSPEARLAIMHRLGIDAVVVDEPEFEWMGQPWLREATTSSPHATQIDVLMRSTLANGRRHALLIEVKLIEDDFSRCSAYESANNDARDVCRSGGPFGSEPRRCFQLRNHDRGERRRYDDALALSPDAVAAGDVGGPGCWFRGGTNQVMRQMALARMMVANHEADEVAVALCAPWSHRAIWRRWSEAGAALTGCGPLLDLPADAVAALLEAPIRDDLAARYRLGPDDPALPARIEDVRRLLESWGPGGLAIENPDAGDGYAAVVGVVVEHEPWTPSQIVLRCHLGFHDYPYALGFPIILDDRLGSTALRLESWPGLRWLHRGTDLRRAGLAAERHPPVRVDFGPVAAVME